MKDMKKNKEQVVKELTLLQRRIDEMESSRHEMECIFEEARRSCQIQTVLNTLLLVALKNIPLEAMIEKFICEITSLSWLTLKSKGAIFLVDEKRNVLEMAAHHALDESLLSLCACVPIGVCLCGLAAATGEIQFADCLDERHVQKYNGMSPHGHYCVPIISRENRVLGVITLYISEGHCRDRREEDFLMAVANTLAGIVELKKAYQQLEERTDDLELNRRELEEVNTALRVLLRKRDEDRLEFEENILFNVKELIGPYLEKLKKGDLSAIQKSYLNILESNLNDIISPLVRKLSNRYLKFTASEIQVANLIIDGKRTKEIAQLLNVSDKTVEVHRKHIRKKLRLRNRRANLRSHLLSFQQ